MSAEFKEGLVFVTFLEVSRKMLVLLITVKLPPPTPLYVSTLIEVEMYNELAVTSGQLKADF